MSEQQSNTVYPPHYWDTPGQPGYPSGQQGYSAGQPANSHGQPQYPSEKPGYPPEQLGFPPRQPAYPAGQPRYPLGQPGYPPGHPGYPPGQPGYPAGQLGQPGYPVGHQGYPPGKSGYPAGPNQPQIIFQQPGRTAMAMHPNIGLSPNSFPTTCPACHRQVQTVRTQEHGPRTHFCALVLCLFCCWPCVPIPYCVDRCKDVKHHCPECHAFIGTYYTHA